MSRVLQEPRSKCVHRVFLAARWKWRRSWASRATQRSKLLSPGWAPTYSPPSDRDTTTSTVSIHTRHRQTHCTTTASKWLWQPMHVLHDLWWTFPPAVALPEAETLRLCLSACPPVSHCLSSRPRHFPAHSLVLRDLFPSPSRETRMLVNRPHTSSNLVFSLLPVPLCEPLINIEIGFPREHMGTHSSAESPKKVGQLWIPSATQLCHHCLFCWDKLDKIRTAYNGPR